MVNVSWIFALGGLGLLVFALETILGQAGQRVHSQLVGMTGIAVGLGIVMTLLWRFINDVASTFGVTGF